MSNVFNLVLYQCPLYKKNNVQFIWWVKYLDYLCISINNLNLYGMKITIEITDNLIDEIIYNLNLYGFEYDNSEYGLPIDIYGLPEEKTNMENMRTIVKDILIKKSNKK